MRQHRDRKFDEIVFGGLIQRRVPQVAPIPGGPWWNSGVDFLAMLYPASTIGITADE